MPPPPTGRTPSTAWPPSSRVNTTATPLVSASSNNCGSTARVRKQSLSDNERGWLTGIDTRIDYSDVGVELDQDVSIRYRYDALGNRVESNANPSCYDANDQVIESIVCAGVNLELTSNLGLDARYTVYGIDEDDASVMWFNRQFHS